MSTVFGKFQLLRKIATGGMGEVFLARHQGARGTEKLLVIKRILPHLLENEGFVGLFRDEARIAAHLNHPNIARLYEIGEIDGSWYLALEYVDGPDLRRVWQQARFTRIPVSHAAICRIIADTAGALHYAHRARDSAGNPLEIVHRDVSPHNVLLGMDGRVKLIDFGIARATNRLEHTETGLLRGKYSYMSPEHLAGGVVDARSDVFALGVVLWEALTGKRLFHAEAELLTINLVSECKVAPPSSVNPSVAAALDAICLKALQKDPAQRFPDADAMRRALEAILAAQRAPLGTPELAAMMQQLFSAPTTGAAELSAPTRSFSGDFVETFFPLEGAAPAVDRQSELTKVEGAAGGGPRELDPATLDEGEGFDAPLLEPAAPQVRLPAPRSRFTGRSKELLRLASFFLCGGRLVTCLGPAGTGKTRLALEYAARSLRAEVPANPGGVLFCPLTEARDPGGICVELARALEIDLAGPDPESEVRQVGAALAARGEVLVILDGFEQVAKYAPQTVGQWLSLAPRARLLVASRAILSLEAEQTLELGLLEAEGEALLTGTVSPAPAPPITAELLRRAGTLPLALELVAGQLRALSPEAVADRLPRGAGGGPARPLTAAAAGEWAWGLLAADEQLALARCSVFRGGFTREAAAAVLGSEAALEGLVRKRLLEVLLPPGEPPEERLFLHEALRELCGGRLRALGREQETKARHAQHFLSLAAALEASLEGPGRASARSRLSRERENLLAVFRHGLEGRREGATDGLLLASMVALDPLLSAEGPPGLQLSMLEAVLERVEGSAEPLPPAQLGRALIARGRALRAAGRVAESNVDFNEALALTGQAADPALEAQVRLELSAGCVLRGRVEAARSELQKVLGLQPLADGLRGRALVALAALEIEAKDAAPAGQHLEQARSIAAAGGDAAAMVAVCLAQHELALLEGHPERAVLELEHAVTACRQARLAAAEGRALLGLAALYRQRALPSEASQYYRAGAARLRGAGQRRLVAQALGELCGLEQEQGRLPQALARCRVALAAASSTEDRRLSGVLLARLGSLLAASQRPAEAEASLDAAAAQLRPLGDPALQTLVEVYRAHAELCRLAANPALAGDAAEAKQRRAKLRALLIDAEQPRAAAADDPLRGAARVLRGALGLPPA